MIIPPRKRIGELWCLRFTLIGRVDLSRASPVSVPVFLWCFRAQLSAALDMAAI
jgi:hypothetical protein